MEESQRKDVPPLTSLCTGCSGCVAACPSGAVAMKLSSDGFWVPVTTMDLCNGCGNCSRCCPVIHSPQPKNRSAEEAVTYAAWVDDLTVRENSSSGGIFTALARSVLAMGGVVFGAAWDTPRTVHHVRVEEETAIPLLRGSKYLPSAMGDVLRQVMGLIGQGRTVLFSGLPCQVAALNLLVESDLLITVDLACHGVPSLEIYRSYLAFIAQGREVRRVNFRDKRTGWSRFSVAIDFADGSDYVSTFREDPFMIGFLANLFSNRPCYDCPFCRMPRQGDITLADYWGVAKELKSDYGVSLVLSNNSKGDKYVAMLPQFGVELHQTLFESTLRGNPRLLNGHRPLPEVRKDLLEHLPLMTFTELYAAYIEVANPFKNS